MGSAIASFHLRPKGGVIQEAGKDGLMSRWSKTGEVVGQSNARILSASGIDGPTGISGVALHAVMFTGFTATGRQVILSRVDKSRGTQQPAEHQCQGDSETALHQSMSVARGSDYVGIIFFHASSLRPMLS